MRTLQFPSFASEMISIGGDIESTQEQAEAGTDAATRMSPRRVKDAINYNMQLNENQSNVAALEALNGAQFSNGDKFYVRGRTTVFDGGQGWYVYQSTATDTADGVVVVLPNDSIGRFIRNSWLSENIIKVRWWAPVLLDTAAQATNGALLGQVFDFIGGQNEGGECQFPFGVMYVERATAYTFTKKRSWRFRGVGDGGKFNSGTRIYLRGGGMDYFIKYRSVLQFHWSDIQFLIQGSGIEGVFDVGSANYYNGDGFTPIPDADAISSYLCTWSRMVFNADVGGGFGPSTAYIWLHSTVNCKIQTCWLTAANRIIKLGEQGLLATDPDGNCLAKGSCGQIQISDCLLDGDIGYVRASNILFMGGQSSKPTGVGAPARAMIFEQIAGGDICHAISFHGMSLGGVGDHSAPFLSSTIATNIVIGKDCVVGRYSTVAIADGESEGWDISPTINVNTQGKPADGILKILSTCTGTDFVCESPHNPDVPYIVKDERVHRETLASAQSAPLRTLLTNSKFDVWRRGTTFAPVAQIFEADRWKARRGGAQIGSTHSRQAGFRGAQYCMRAQRDVGNATTGALFVGQQIFSADCYALQGKTLFISADVRAGANFSGPGVSCTIYSGTGIDEVGDVGAGFATGNTSTVVGTVSPTTTGQTLDFGLYAVPSDATELLIAFRETPAGTAGAADYFEITNVNVTTGYRPSPYVPLSVAAEEAATLPYCQKSFIRGTTPVQAVGTSTGEVRSIMQGTAAVVNYASHQLETRMWSTPTCIFYNPVSANNQFYNMTDAADCSGTNVAGITDHTIEWLYTGNAAGAPGDRVAIHFLAVAGV